VKFIFILQEKFFEINFSGTIASDKLSEIFRNMEEIGVSANKINEIKAGVNAEIFSTIDEEEKKYKIFYVYCNTKTEIKNMKIDIHILTGRFISGLSEWCCCCQGNVWEATKEEFQNLKKNRSKPDENITAIKKK